MKVFLSWSGDKSHKVACVFRDWLPSVIQSLFPYVSSEDIDKGTRWSTDIAEELKDATFGILCVTKENLDAPWLNFEAGALSKTIDNTFVNPFLFDINRSEVNGPILQFQSTIFEKNDIFKLIKTINKASGEETLSEERLAKTFDVWYPSLEEELNKLKSFSSEVDSDKDITINQSILEEILDLSRANQKLLRNPDGETVKEISAIKELLESTLDRHERDLRRRVKTRRFHSGFIEDIINYGFFKDKSIGIQIILGFFKEDFPWIYDAGMETIRIFKTSQTTDEKSMALESFMRLIDFTFENPIMRDYLREDKSQYMLLKELAFLFKRIIME